MEKTAFDTRYHGYLTIIEDYLNGLFVQENHWTDLYEAMRYSLLSGGKRLRPVMTLEFARLCGLDWHRCCAGGLRAGAGSHLLPDPRRPALHGR